MVKVNPGSSYKTIGSTRVPDAVYQVSKSWASWFRRRRFLKFFTIYGHGHVTWNIWTNFHSPWRLHMKFGFSRPNGFWAEVWKCWIWVTLDEDQWMTLTNDIHKGSCTHLVDWIYQLWYHRLQQFLKNPWFYLFPIQKQKDQIWPCRKIGQGQPRVIIWINLVELRHGVLVLVLVFVLTRVLFFQYSVLCENCEYKYSYLLEYWSKKPSTHKYFLSTTENFFYFETVLQQGNLH